MPTPGKYGRISPDPERPKLTLEKYLDPRRDLTRAGLPPVAMTADVDRASKVASWPMYLNDQLGDCTIAGLAHMFGAWTTYNGQAPGEALFGDDEIEQVYSRIGGYVPGDEDTDQGCMMSDVLADAKAAGITDVHGKTHKIAGYAAFGDPTNETLLGQVLEVFGSVYVGFNVQASIENEFAEGKPWTYTPGEEFVGGHCVVLQHRAPEGSRTGILQYVTWGALQYATESWQAHTVEEAWAPVTQDWLTVNGASVEGLDLTQLLADMEYV